jgi:hypothetical protein
VIFSADFFNLLLLLAWVGVQSTGSAGFLKRGWMLFVRHPEMGNELKFVKSKELKLKKSS